MTPSVSPTADQNRPARTYREAARELAVCERSIWTLVRDGKLRSFRVGRAVRIPATELDRFIAQQCEQA